MTAPTTALRPVRTARAQSDALYDGARVRAMFDRMSRSYECMNIIMSFGFSVRWRQQLMGLISRLPAAPRVLDVMSGRGETWPHLLRRFPGGHLTAIDFSPRMTAHARARSRDRFDDRVTVLHADALDSGLAAASVDLIVSAYGLKTLSEQQSEEFADEIARLLRPGGRFAFIEVTEPASRPLRALYDFYLSCVVPAVAGLFVSDPEEYGMLHRYLRSYRDGARTARALRAHPELEVEVRTHFFGCATSFSGRRRA